MILNLKRLIDIKVDTKNLRVNSINFLLIITSILFPLNQQLHIRPFPSVEGFIIDYLITKISIPEILLIFISVLRLPEIAKEITKSLNLRISTVILLFFLTLSSLRSDYLVLSLYESLIIMIIFLNAVTLNTVLTKSHLDIFIKSIKFWMILLSFLGVLQFYFQSSVLNSYALFGEFPYSEDYYHIKQKGFLFQYLIPPYSIFSHSNIFGGFILISIMVLGFFKKDSLIYHAITVTMLTIIGSLNIVVGYFFWIFLIKMKNFKVSKLLFFGFLCSVYFTLFLFSSNYQAFSDNSSVYRRLYMFDLSREIFWNRPGIFLFGSGYFNYFNVVKENLYDYEVVRFFQPTHNLFNFLIWQYGFIFVLFILFVFWNLFNKLNQSQIKFLVVILLASMFDHFFITNHQIKFYIFLFVPYSLMPENSIK